MVWPFSSHSDNKDIRNAWGHKFQWTPHHLTPEQMHPLKYTYDQLADDCLDILDRIDPPKHDLPNKSVVTDTPPNKPENKSEKKQDKKPKRDLYSLLEEHASKDPALGELWAEVNTVPDWVDWDQITRGQEVFYRYGGAALTGLAYQSLLGGMGANRVVETLARTGGFSPKVARRRMYETTQHILQCTMSLESIKPGGAGHKSSVRVRLLHSSVRRRIMALAKQKPGYYDAEKWGVPVNDLDSIATISTFSASLIWLSFPCQGIWLREQEIKDYVALWRLIAYYVGTPTEYFTSPEKARGAMESLLLFEINPSETSKVLANNIITSLESQPPSFASRPFLIAGARWLNGNELADALGLMKTNLWCWALVAGQCLFFMFICYTYRSIPFLDRRKNQVSQSPEINRGSILIKRAGRSEDILFYHRRE
ncbi:MAG: hypothetical protein M1814_000826 [Vezdaea aestivalis]|nr:MAG: hypothetical protein M1814_000826 [Vezdaea aestivalis]